MRRLVACVLFLAGLGAIGGPLPKIELQAIGENSYGIAGSGSDADVKALDEMLGDRQHPRRWKQAPALKILTSVMHYRAGSGVEYVAASEQLSESEMAELEKDLTAGLGVLTANTFERFSSVGRYSVPAGATANVGQPNHIVVGRFKGLREATKTLGLGGRRVRKDGSIMAGVIMLDSEYDRTNTLRNLLRTHELGHALGYNHVLSRASIMNVRIGTPLNDFDREAALIAFPHPMRASR